MYANYRQIRNEHCIPLSSFELLEIHKNIIILAKDSQFKFSPGKDNEQYKATTTDYEVTECYNGKTALQTTGWSYHVKILQT